MHQTLQSTGVCWALHLVIPGVQTIQLAYGSNIKEVLSKLQPRIPLSVKPDHILSKYFRVEGSGMKLIKGNMIKRGKWQGSSKRRKK